MFRISQYMRELVSSAPESEPGTQVRKPPGPVGIWNLIRRCNLTCKHCYSISADRDFPGELSTPEVAHSAPARTGDEIEPAVPLVAGGGDDVDVQVPFRLGRAGPFGPHTSGKTGLAIGVRTALLTLGHPFPPATLSLSALFTWCTTDLLTLFGYLA